MEDQGAAGARDLAELGKQFRAQKPRTAAMIKANRERGAKSRELVADLTAKHMSIAEIHLKTGLSTRYISRLRKPPTT